ncbi:GGDEF domain-containing protein [Sphingomonas sp. ASY06-1R]|jgi:diguanylate cyclase (GGDEF)-like protein|uniref:GGDEF domain-containing protein n=1 Tax=Sphingomonas sp. ASY06-1R TaxID=3445771 RepID=UPI003FA1FED1
MAPFSRTDLRNERDLAHYILLTTLLCVSIALAVDVANQLFFFTSWTNAIRSWVITVIVVVCIAVPVTRKLGRAQLALYRAGMMDELTGLLNRRAFLDGVDDTTFLALIIVDIDDFKNVNDRHGHWIGDQVLRTTATMMDRLLGQFGRVGRLGGEEFALLAYRDDHATLLDRLEAFRDTIAHTPILTDSVPVSVTISAGVATRHGDQTFQELFIRADGALYQAKASGRNRVVLANDAKAGGSGNVSRDAHPEERRWPGR